LFDAKLHEIQIQARHEAIDKYTNHIEESHRASGYDFQHY